MNLIAVGLDIAKSVFQVHGVDAQGKASLRKQLRRSDVLRFFGKLAPCLVGIEACHSSHFWGRELTKLGHRVRLIPTQYVKPYLLGGKNDANDASAICAAAMRPDMHAVAIKDAEQQSLQSLHRMRQRLVLERTAKSNQIGSMFAEEGLVFPISIAQLRRSVAKAIGDPQSNVTPILRRLGTMYLEQLGALERWLTELNEQLQQIATEREDCKLLTSIPGVGPIVATALIGTVGDTAAVQERAAVCGVGGIDASAAFQWWKDSARWHYETRRRVPADDVDPRRSGRSAICHSTIRQPSDMAATAHATPSQERSHRGSR